MRKLTLSTIVLAFGLFMVSCASGTQSSGTDPHSEVQSEESTQSEESGQSEESTQSEESGQKTKVVQLEKISQEGSAQADDTEQAQEPANAEKHTFSELFTDDQITVIRRTLKVPDEIEVTVKVGNSYFWEGGNMNLAQVDFYNDGQYCAGAACEVGTSNVVKNIYSY